MIIDPISGKSEAIGSVNYTYENLLDQKSKGPSTVSAVFNQQADL
jgi:hypothetical protein